MPLFFFFFFVSISKEVKSQQKEQNKKDAIDHVLHSLVKLLPYLNNDIKFKDPHNKQKILGHMNKIKSSFKKSDHQKKFYIAGFRPSVGMVFTHVDETINSFKKGNTPFARKKMASMTGLCISCHGQLKKKNKGFLKSAKHLRRSQFKNDLEYADSLFLIRDYQKATHHYKLSIKEKLQNLKEKGPVQKDHLHASIERALKRIITIHTKISFQPDRTYNLLEEYENNKEIPNHLKTKITSYKKQIKKWINLKPSFKIKNEEGLHLFINKYLKDKKGNMKLKDDGSSDISLLISSGLLFKFMNHGPEYELIPIVYFWLNQIERRLDFNFFYSLADVYLKECILSYPREKIAKQCFKRYQENITHDFKGPPSIKVPAGLKEEIKRLKKLLLSTTNAQTF